MTIEECYNRVLNALDSIEECNEALFSASSSLTRRIIDMQRERLWSGKNTEESDITPEYAESTVKRKMRVGHPYDRVTLKDTGDMYGSIFVNIKADELITYSKAEYTKYLVSRYSKIFGLTENNKNETREMSVSLILEWFREKTNL